MGRIQRLRAFFVAAALAAGWVVALPAPAAAAVPVGLWSSLNAGTSEGLISISCPGSGTCYAVGGNGTIIVTRDGGASWSSLVSGTSNRLDSISCPGVLTCFVAGPFPPTLLVTTDGGASWLDKSSFAPQPLAAISCADVITCVAVGLVGTTVRTSDGGATWSTSNAPTGSFLLGVSCPTTTTCYADGAATSAIVKTDDGGANWSDVTPVSAAFLDIFCSSALACIAVGSPGLGDAPIMTTGDGGTTWTNRASNTTNDLAGVSCFGVGHCFAVGRSGVILASDDAGAAWSPQQNTSNYLSTVSCLSASICFAVGQFGTLMASPAGPRTVTNANDAGPGSLRGAIDYANGHQGPDTITFGIDSGPHSIALQSGLPAITDPAVIDASTQPGYAGAPIIELNGAAFVAHGLTVRAGPSTIRGFVINRFRGFGVSIELGNGNVVAGNYIGTNMAGNAPGPNASNGVVVSGPSTNNLIGGPAPADRNVISGNGDKGVVLVNGGSATVQGNFLGTDASGTAPLPNTFFGVSIESSNGSRIVDNLISGNAVAGVNIFGGSHDNVIEHNLIGTNAAGTGALGNGWGGGVVVAESPNNTIGRGNVISANGNNGISIYGAGSVGERVVGNRIGTDVTGTRAMGNSDSGVGIASDHNTVGGSDPADLNLVSGNGGDGVQIGGLANTVVGNYIGTDAAGHNAIGNSFNGVTVSGSQNNIVSGNLLSGNLNSGVLVYGDTGMGNLIQGNLIGTDAGGISPLPNQWWGVVLDGAPNNTVGGASDTGRNVISGNTYDGILVSNTFGNLIQNNYIGLGVDGTTPVPNQGLGVALNQSGGTTVGGWGRNVIAGNGQAGIGLFNAHGSTIQGNYIGIDRSGQNARPNRAFGINVSDSNHAMILGNVISANAYDGVYIQGSGSDHATLQGNFIGTDASGHAGLGNGGSGVTLESAADTLIGGTSETARNVISSNAANGVFMFGYNPAARNVVQGNYVGTDVTGSVALGNRFNGIQVDHGIANYVGGTASGAGNLISGNAQNGVMVTFSAGTNYVQSNLIGTNSGGTAAVPNGAGPGLGTFGIWIGFSGGTVIGENTIAGNNFGGIVLFGDATTGTQMEGNYIGTNAAGAALGNRGNGVIIDAGASRNMITRNVVANNDFNGIVVWSGTGDALRANSIYSNGAMGIDLNNDGVTLNDRGDRDGGANNSQNFPVLSRVVGSPSKLVVEGSIDTPNPQTVTIEIYANASPNPGADFTGYGEGQTLIGTVTPNGAGRFTIALAPMPKGTVITATATDAQGNTSEFALDKTA